MTATADLFAPVQCAYGWVHQAAHILSNESKASGEQVRETYEALLEQMRRDRAAAGTLAEAVAHFLKVTVSYAPGLFACYDEPAIPRTNNDLEQTFGHVRHGERRATGRKGASPMVVVRGAVHVVAAVVTACKQMPPTDLYHYDHQVWLQVRQEMDTRHQLRLSQRHFRRNPEAYLASLEDRLSKAILPP